MRVEKLQSGCDLIGGSVLLNRTESSADGLTELFLSEFVVDSFERVDRILICFPTAEVGDTGDSADVAAVATTVLLLLIARASLKCLH